MHVRLCVGEETYYKGFKTLQKRGGPLVYLSRTGRLTLPMPQEHNQSYVYRHDCQLAEISSN